VAESSASVSRSPAIAPAVRRLKTTKPFPGTFSQKDPKGKGPEDYIAAVTVSSSWTAIKSKTNGTAIRDNNSTLRTKAQEVETFVVQRSKTTAK
jgi:hypothetical protein